MTQPARSTRPVLLVDDNADLQAALTLLLERAGFKVTCASDGREALRKLCEGLKPCVIVLDYHMPVMDGAAFRERQLAAGLQVHVPVVVYSADPYIDVDGLAIADVIRKPVEMTDIVRVVERFS
jgi:CheY-like chemotaxis protein